MNQVTRTSARSVVWTKRTRLRYHCERDVCDIVFCVDLWIIRVAAGRPSVFWCSFTGAPHYLCVQGKHIKERVTCPACVGAPLTAGQITQRSGIKFCAWKQGKRLLKSFCFIQSEHIPRELCTCEQTDEILHHSHHLLKTTRCLVLHVHVGDILVIIESSSFHMSI